MKAAEMEMRRWIAGGAEVSEERAGFMGHQTGRVKKPRGHEEAGGDVKNEQMKERVGQWEG